MARAREPESRIGGGMPAVATESLAGEKNRMLEAMRQRSATERGKIQAQAQIQSTQIGAESRREVAAMQAMEADRRAAERVRGQHLDRKFMESQTRLTQHLISEREEAARLASALAREEDWQKFSDLYKKHEGNVVARDKLEAAQRKRFEGGLIDLATRGLDTQEKMQKLFGIESDRVDKLTEAKKVYSNVAKRIDDRITSYPYLTTEDELVGNIQDFLDEDFKELGIDRAKAATLLLVPERKETFARGIAAGQIKADDLQKIYMTLKKRKGWAKESLDELYEEGDKLRAPGRYIFPFEEFIVKEEDIFDPGGWTQARLLTKKPSKILLKRQQRLAGLTAMVDSFENLRDSKEKMVDGSGEVGDFIGKLIAGLNSPITFDYKAIMKAGMPDLKRVREDLNRHRDGERFDWDRLIESATTPYELEALQRTRIIEEGGRAEEAEEPEEVFNFPGDIWD